MEALIKIIYFLCLASASINSQLVSSLDIHTPVLDLGIGAHNGNVQNNANSIYNSPVPQSKTCFCIPTNTNGLPVTSLMDPLNDTQRLVVYLYKNNGDLKVYVPNKIKQKALPELNFDYNEGDILKPATSDSIVDIFDSEIVMPQENIVNVSEDVVNESESLVVDNVVESNMDPDTLWKPVDKPADIPVNVVNEYTVPSNDNIFLKPLHEDNDQLTISTNENTYLDKDIAIEEPVDISQPSIETQNNPYVDQTSQIIFGPQSKPEKINNLDLVIDSQNLETVTNLADSGQQKPIITIIDSQPSINTNINQPDDSKIVLDQITKFDNYDQIQQQIFSPQNSQPHSLPNQHSINLIPNPYISFYDWFDIQLNHFVIYNIETQIQVVELREKIKKILQDNGLIVSVKGIVTDSNGNLVRMNNLKLRPILIGSTIDAQNFSYQTNLPQTGVSYIQLIEVILVTPPKLLGTLVLGTVYLPRKIQGEQVLRLDGDEKEIIGHKFGWSNAHGCSSCSLKPTSRSFIPQIRYPGVITTGVRTQTVPIPEVRKFTTPYSSYGNYYALPFRRKILRNGLTYNRPLTATLNPYRTNAKVVSKGRAGILDGLLGSVGPMLFGHPSRRVLGGNLPQGPKPGPKSYPNDGPGFRIIGGNAATSSGTPLANKGRSGFETPSNII